MTRPIPAVPPITTAQRDIWGRSASLADVLHHAGQDPEVRQREEHLWAFLCAIYAEPNTARDELDRLCLVGAEHPASWEERETAITTTARNLADDPCLVGRLAGREWLARQNARSLPYLVQGYYGRRLVTARRRQTQILSQIERDALAIPAFPQDAAAFLAELQELVDQERKLIDRWHAEGAGALRHRLTSYAEAVRARLGPATPRNYFRAAARAAVFHPTGRQILPNLRQAIRTMRDIEKIAALAETAV